YLADTESHTVRAVDLNPDPAEVILIAGTGKKGDGPDEPDPLQCEMARLHGVGVDPISGDLLIGDSETNKIRRIISLPGELPLSKPSLGSYDTEEFTLSGRSCRITKPKVAAPGNPWIWRARFYGAFPSVDEALLAEGWHVAWIDVSHLFGAPEAMKAFEELYAKVTTEHGLHPRPILEGFSRGGLAATNWTILNPDKVAGLYLDAPVLDIHSWPKGASVDLWSKAMAAYRIDETSADNWKGPLDGIGTLLENEVPLFLVAGGNDEVVPFLENGGILEKEYLANEGPIISVVKAGAGHHPHSLHDPSRVIAWAKGLID
ncbi:MAG: hypothetical protein AAGF67_16585, partial [Verrucomicrobiota bacterium]